MKISSNKIKDNFGSSEKKVVLPFYFLLCLFCCQLSLKMSLFAKATILLNELVLLLCLVYFHKWNMKGGKYNSEKTARDKNQNGIKKDLKSCWGMYHTHFSPLAAGWPSKILLMDLPSSQTLRLSLQPLLQSSRLYAGDFEEWISATAVTQMCYVRPERSEWGLTGDIQGFVRAEWRPSSTCASVSVPE